MSSFPAKALILLLRNITNESFKVEGIIFKKKKEKNIQSSSSCKTEAAGAGMAATLSYCM